MLGIAGVAPAATLTITSIVATGVNPTGTFDPSVSGFSAINGTIGTLSADGSGDVFYTYLGKEAGYTNAFLNTDGSDPSISTTDLLGTSSTQAVTGGALNFAFQTTSNSDPALPNGSATNNCCTTFAIFGGGSSGYQYVLGFDDTGAGPDRDFDDMVIGVNFRSAEVPLPGTLGLLGLGLAALGMVRRRQH